MSRRIFVSLPDGAHDVIRDLKGTLGDTSSEVVRNLVVAYLVEKGYLLKSKVPADKQSVGQAINMHDISIAALITVLNGVMTPKDSFYEAYKTEVGKMLESQS